MNPDIGNFFNSNGKVLGKGAYGVVKAINGVAYKKIILKEEIY